MMLNFNSSAVPNHIHFQGDSMYPILVMYQPYSDAKVLAYQYQICTLIINKRTSEEFS